MGANTEDQHLIIQFSDKLHVKAQQIRARLRPFVEMRKMVGDRFAYDGLGQVETREVLGRNVPTQFDDIERNRRKIKRRRFVVTLPIDASDVRGSLINPDSHLAEACIRAMERNFDRVGVEAAFADVETGRDFETTVTFANDGGNTVNATAGFTYEKLLEINKFFRNNEVNSQMKERMIGLFTGTEEEALMQEIELISGDFSRRFVVDAGEITRGVGVEYLVFGADVPVPILNVSGSVRDNIFMSSRALSYGMSKQMGVTIKDRPDFVETKQVQVIGELGAVRTEGLLLQKVTTTI